MATAKKVTAVVPLVVNIELTLTVSEADALLTICGQIGGTAATTRRRHFDAIGNALHSVGNLISDPSDLMESRKFIWFTTEVK